MRVRIGAAIVVAVVLGAGIIALTVNAAAHYARGRQAMAARHYGAAVEEFASARVLTVWYRDAKAMGERAQQGLELDAAQADVRRQERVAIYRLLAKARDGVGAGDIEGALYALREVRVLVPAGPLPRTAAQRDAQNELLSSLAQRGRQAIATGSWDVAARAAEALLLVDPANPDGIDLTQRAREALALRQDMNAAKAAADAGHWREALRLAKRVQRRWPGFPGSAALIASARIALTPPKPKATPSPARTRPPVTTPTQPPAPAPAPPPP